MNLTWNASTDNVGVTGYEVFRDGALLATTTGTGTGFSDTTASPSTTHSYQVRARDAASNLSAFSNTATVTTPTPVDATPPTAPANLTGTAVSPTQVNLTWNASTDNVGVTGYQVFRDGALLATTTGTGTGYSDTTASPSTTHSYQVRARDAANNLSAFSNTATVTTPTPPDTQAPTDPSQLAGNRGEPDAGRPELDRLDRQRRRRRLRGLPRRRAARNRDRDELHRHDRQPLHHPHATRSAPRRGRQPLRRSATRRR